MNTANYWNQIFNFVMVSLLAITCVTAQTQSQHKNHASSKSEIVSTSFENKLGMKFVAIPGTDILMCVHETRNKDYAAYVAETKGVDMSWEKPKFDWGNKGVFFIKDNLDHPVIRVNWDEANAFCKWLSQTDGRVYRLPMDHEWSCAVGIGEKEDSKLTPRMKSGKIAGYPWGGAYPPPSNNVGNFEDNSLIKKGLATGINMKNYSDGYPFTAPVMTYAPNSLGIFDLGGNVREWCQDFYDEKQEKRVNRGAGWNEGHFGFLSSANRNSSWPLTQSINTGFRCVVEIEKNKSK